ncbi:MAG: phytanoyl-CoA dioxygenase [Benjaminiella poitrasii]|nr:MAG: phytanoyl-CoA dioxygenase [Benjaminiella poitrasii]
MTVLTKEQLAQFDRNGCLVINDFFSISRAEALKSRAKELLTNFSLEGHPMTQFSTGTSNQQHVGDDYFLTSGNKIHFFFEEGAFDDHGQLKVSKERAINKIGHGLHILDPAFKAFSINETISAMTREIGFQSPQVLQSMLIFKQPYIGGRVPSHQDSSFLYTKPLSAVGFWFALEDCTETNGCLWFKPGSHKTTPISKRFVRDPEGTGTKFIPVENHSSSTADENDDEFVKCEVKAGALVLIHGSVVHKSAPNFSPTSRYIYTFHVIEGKAEYLSDNWLQPQDGEQFTSV